MTHAHGGILVLLVAFALGAIAGNLAVLVLRPLLLGRDASALGPGQLAHKSGALLLLPAALGLLAVVGTLSIPAAALLRPELDHCTLNPAAPHVCFAHGTLVFSSPLEAAGVLVLGAWLLLSLASELRRLARARRFAAALTRGAGDARVGWTDDEAPFAYAVGLLRPRVVASSGLRRALAPAQLEAALAHEAAHADGRDALARALLRVFSRLLLPALRRPLTELHVFAQERRADETAARVVGSRALVAETLLALARVAPRPAPAPALLGPTLPLRVESLCRAPVVERAPAPRTLVAAALLLALGLAAGGTIHESAEIVASALTSSSPVHHHPPHS